MKTEANQVLNRALALSALEKAQLVDHILSSLDKPDETIDNLWRKEVKDRIKAYKSGDMKSISLKEVLSKYQQ